MQKFRVRIAPSPSGTLHIGNAKTALFNYLFSQKYDADFVLRIEDTDQSRTVEKGAEKIQADLDWLGIKPNMGYGTDNKPAGVYTQMERLPIYKKIVYKLLESGLAYKCYCSQDELSQKRDEAFKQNPKVPFKYPGTCRSIIKDLNKPYVIRFKAPTEGSISFKDIVFGQRSISNKENYDFVLMRENGIPLYNTAVVIDDGITDNITHIIRGSDHIKNMVSQILLYQALKLELPVYCHLPMLLGTDGSKLTKRNGSVSVADYRNKGYSPQAILNYLVKFGWGHGNQEIFSIDEMIGKFTLEACHCRDGKYDPVKFGSINYSHLKSEELTPNNIYIKHLEPFLEARGLPLLSKDQLKPFIKLIRSRAKTFVEAAEMLDPMLRNEIQINSDLLRNTILSSQEAVDNLITITQILSAVETWNETSIKEHTTKWLAERNLMLKDVGSVLRVALLGSTNSPDLFQVISVLGKEKSISRIKNSLRAVAH